MDEYLRQHRFEEKNIALYYLSPYVQMQAGEEGIYIGRESRDAAILLADTAENRYFLKRLSEGVTEEELAAFVGDTLREDVQDWTAYCIQGGLIE